MGARGLKAGAGRCSGFGGSAHATHPGVPPLWLCPTDQPPWDTQGSPGAALVLLRDPKPGPNPEGFSTAPRPRPSRHSCRWLCPTGGPQKPLGEWQPLCGVHVVDLAPGTVSPAPPRGTRSDPMVQTRPRSPPRSSGTGNCSGCTSRPSPARFCSYPQRPCTPQAGWPAGMGGGSARHPWGPLHPPEARKEPRGPKLITGCPSSR